MQRANRGAEDNGIALFDGRGGSGDSNTRGSLADNECCGGGGAGGVAGRAGVAGANGIGLHRQIGQSEAGNACDQADRLAVDAVDGEDYCASRCAIGGADCRGRHRTVAEAGGCRGDRQRRRGRRGHHGLSTAQCAAAGVEAGRTGISRRYSVRADAKTRPGDTGNSAAVQGRGGLRRSVDGKDHCAVRSAGTRRHRTDRRSEHTGAAKWH